MFRLNRWIKQIGVVIVPCVLLAGTVQAVTLQQLQQKKAQLNRVEALKKSEMNQLLNQMVELKLSNPTRYAVLMDWLHLEQQTAILATLQRLTNGTRNALPASTVVNNQQGETLEIMGQGFEILAPIKQQTN